jgi:hypothetical protein
MTFWQAIAEQSATIRPKAQTEQSTRQGFNK